MENFIYYIRVITDNISDNFSIFILCVVLALGSLFLCGFIPFIFCVLMFLCTVWWLYGASFESP